MDIGDTIAPKSDQQNFDDYELGPRTVTVSGVKVIKSEQPVHLELTEYPGRPFKPNKSMRRVLIKVWGTDSSAYVGRRLTLFGNPKVIYGGKAVGGIEISHMSGIDKPATFSLTAIRGQRKQFTVQPLRDAPAPAQQPARNWSAEIDAADIPTLQALWSEAPENYRQTIEARAAQLKEAQ